MSWLRTRRPLEAPRARLLCLPYAGAGATIYSSWAASVPNDVELRAAQLPARQDRFREPGWTDVSRLVGAISRELGALPEAPLVIYGHSFGALLGFELARSLEPSPRHLVVGGHRAPNLPRRHAPIAHLPDDALCRAASRLYGLDPRLFDHPEIRELALPPLRADLTAVAEYGFVERDPPDLPITVFTGDRDRAVLPEEARAWSEVTRGSVDVHVLDAGHLFLESHRETVLRHVLSILGRIRSPAAGTEPART